MIRACNLEEKAYTKAKIAQEEKERKRMRENEWIVLQNKSTGIILCYVYISVYILVSTHNYYLNMNHEGTAWLIFFW